MEGEGRYILRYNQPLGVSNPKVPTDTPYTLEKVRRKPCKECWERVVWKSRMTDNILQGQGREVHSKAAKRRDITQGH